uniref:cytochrome c oxidase subunit II n=1 Tax=Hygrobates turcicus TaxID=2028090 RepID=UPI0022390756|nr:cytochrome c oxidase subunit II [Hygrobates turcicus]UYS90922.1 cytochrome c oxidase subunit 2 [Hygrobates turcicus]
MPMWMAISFQDSNSPMMEHMMFFHDHTMIVVVTVTAVVGYLLASSITSNTFKNSNEESDEMEVFWTMIPASLLLFIALPSLKILYLGEEASEFSLTVKCTGNQWFWSYEYADLKTLQFDSFMMNNQLPRLLCTNNHLILPSKTPIHALVTSVDVIHSWAIPSLGVKVDAIPGRLNQTNFIINRTGVLFGQCSEICGVNHSFMPIMISSLPLDEFMKSAEKI